MPQQAQQPSHLTNHGPIAWSVRSHVRPEVFFNALKREQHKPVRQRRQRQVMMEADPRTAFMVIQSQIGLAALKILFDRVAAPAQPQAAGLLRRPIQLGQVTVIGAASPAGQSTTSHTRSRSLAGPSSPSCR